MTMKLIRFRVTNFRSVADSDWIQAENVTALIGTNESGKTNLLVPLWKLNPAKDGEINLTADYPRKRLTEFRGQAEQPDFIEALFEATDTLASKLSELTGSSPEDLREVAVVRDFAGDYAVSFPGASEPRTVSAGRVQRLLDEAHAEISQYVPIKIEGDLGKQVNAAIQAARDQIPPDAETHLGADVLDRLVGEMADMSLDAAAKTSIISPRFQRLKQDVQAIRDEIARPLPEETEGVHELVMSHLPNFVYYSNYGNLDSEIYLPHVIENMKRPGLGAKEAAKVRTLKVLFRFVGLSPEEILELGQDFPESHRREPNAEEISAIAEKKKLRSILLQSASAKLTDKFREWWKQGDYRFRFEADGDHFRIWVSDDKRPEEIELEGRSTGLQWFLSFYLVFLVESEDAHESAILLLDEPGLSLHPLAQRDLSLFFDGLSATNQLIYTTHSPFLVDADHLERVRRVYVGNDGTTRSSEDLRATAGEPGQRGSAYAVHAALNLTVAESLLLGCEPVIVEGVSDQHYLTAIKSILVSAGRLKPGRELVFPPAGGAKGVKPVVSLLLGRDEELPVAFFDSDPAGRTFAQQLRSALYSDAPQRVFQVGDFVNLADAEVEDLIPKSIIASQLDRWLRSAETPFADVMRDGEAVVPQIQQWAATQKLELPLYWKVELSKRVKAALLSQGVSGVPLEILDVWEGMFSRFIAGEDASAGTKALSQSP